MSTSTEDEIKERHEELKQDLAVKIDRQAFWESTVSTEHWAELATNVRDTIQRCRVDLETAKSEDIKTLQSQISARKEMLSLIEAKKSFTPVTDARRRLEEYEQQNAIFLKQ